MHTRIRVIAAALVGIAISVMVGGVGLAKDKPCKNVHGRLISQQVMGTACASPVGLCTAGNFFGGIKGTFTFTANTLTPTTDTPQTGVFTYTGDIAVSTKDGTYRSRIVARSMSRRAAPATSATCPTSSPRPER